MAELLGRTLLGERNRNDPLRGQVAARRLPDGDFALRFLRRYFVRRRDTMRAGQQESRRGFCLNFDKLNAAALLGVEAIVGSGNHRERGGKCGGELVDLPPIFPDSQFLSVDEHD